eukprot:CAMPEP_0197864412 /NCGR_PEP_ID=MMETSP1438-20131217/42658_1 /TAXON_ID=1461541 /ORGANISM="Pterosperma sp., Strain CCMP1384" /LENGTH=112 /DNA_ID=CAMNT_0043482663 /DNA_START=32 /DNA_END=370 /DNA_ORIENTATION=+
MAVHRLHLDVLILLSFLTSLPTPGLTECLQEPHQFTDLFLLGDMARICDSTVRASSLSALTNARLIPALQKYKDFDHHKFDFFHKHNSKFPHRSDIDEIVKKLQAADSSEQL